MVEAVQKQEPQSEEEELKELEKCVQANDVIQCPKHSLECVYLQ